MQLATVFGRLWVMFINYCTKASNTFSGVVMLVYYISVSDRARC